MTPNVGTVDRLLRFVVGVALLALLALNETNLRWIGLAGIVLIGTAFIRFCPLYVVLGLRTCPREN